jgi:hypothetical protein
MTVVPRLTLQMQYLLISIQPLLINEPFVTTVSEETRLLSQAIPTQWVTVNYSIACCYFLCSSLRRFWGNACYNCYAVITVTVVR